MSLQQTVLTDLVHAMKTQDAETLGVLRMLKAAFLHEAKSVGGSDELDDATVLAILKKEGKKRKDSIDAYTRGNRIDLADIEKRELAIIEKYLPQELSDEEIDAIVDAVIQEMSNPQFGAVMGAAMKEIAGRADGDRVKACVEKKLVTS